MRLSITHRYDFGLDAAVVGETLAGPAAWDALRLRTSGAFALPATREELAAAAGEPSVRERAAALDALLRERGVASLASYGVGRAALELALLALDDGRRLVLTELAPETAHRLAQLLPEAEVRLHDLRRDGPVADVDLHLLHRVDTELGDRDFRATLARFSHVALIVVATELLGPRALAREVRTRLRRGSVRAGLVRSRGAFEALFRPTHTVRRIELADHQAWLLEPRPR